MVFCLIIYFDTDIDTEMHEYCILKIPKIYQHLDDTNVLNLKWNQKISFKFVKHTFGIILNFNGIYFPIRKIVNDDNNKN